jgi:hypothetical protein
MTVTSSPVFVQAPVTQHLLLLPAHGTRYRPLWRPDLTSARAAPNGANIAKIMAASNDAGNNEIQIGIAKALTLVANMGTATFVDGGGGSDTLTRSAGDFSADGWNAGDRIQVLGATTVANDFDAILSSVAAGTLTFPTATVSTGEAMPAGSMLLRLTTLWRKSILASAGNSASVNPQSLLDNAVQAALNAAPKRFLDLGADDFLFARVTTTLNSGETMDLVAEGRAY